MTTPISPTETKPLWRTGTKLGRTLYRGGVCVGLVDTPEIAAEIVDALNRAAVEVSNAETERHIKALKACIRFITTTLGYEQQNAALDAVAYLRALQQRVTELEKKKAASDTHLIETMCEDNTEIVSLMAERDAAKRELALRLDGHSELKALYASFSPRHVANPDEAARYVSKLRAELEAAKRELAERQATLEKQRGELELEVEREFKDRITMLANEVTEALADRDEAKLRAGDWHRAYDTLRENHVDLQRKASELEEAVRTFFSAVPGYREPSDDDRFYVGDADFQFVRHIESLLKNRTGFDEAVREVRAWFAPLKRLHPRNNT